MLKQYGCIPYVKKNGSLKVVMITSASGYWIFPKGQFEEELGKKGTAELEAMEEAGVEGKIRKKNSYRAKVVIKSGDLVSLTLYALEVKMMHDVWKEKHRRRRKVVSLKEAEKLISSDALMNCLRKLERDLLA